jgi:hypothetical protein
MSTAMVRRALRIETHRNPDEAMPVRRLTKNALMDRPATRKDSGTKDTAFRGRRKAKRVRARKAQRQARRVQQ